MLSAEEKLTRPSGPELPSLNRGKVREKLAALYEVRLTRLGNLYSLKRDKKYLELCEPVLVRLEDYLPDSYSAPLVPMIYETTSLLRLVSGRGGFDG